MSIRESVCVYEDEHELRKINYTECLFIYFSNMKTIECSE
jgi:hypothetical protein